MLRRLLLILVTVALVGIAFYLVARSQPVPKGVGTTSVPFIPPQPARSQSPSGLGNGQLVYLDSFENGTLTSQFTAAEYLPQKDSSFDVTKPIAIFYLSNGQYLLLTGDTGVVWVDSTNTALKSAGPIPGGSQSPNTGRLHNVHLALYPNVDSTTPTLWMETENLWFNKTTMKLYTEAYVDASGRTVAADRVPVTVRGDDYEFDGYGLTLCWNPLDKRLQLLRINYGNRLEIKHPSKLSLPGFSTSPGRTAGMTLPRPLAGNVGKQRVNVGLAYSPTASTGALNGRRICPPYASPENTATPDRFDANFDRLGGMLLASAAPAEQVLFAAMNDSTVVPAVSNALPPNRAPVMPASTPEKGTIYHAIFHDQVRVKQGERIVATSETLAVDFLQGNDRSQNNSTTAETAPTTAAPAGADAAVPRAARDLADGIATTQPNSTKNAVQPTTSGGTSGTGATTAPAPGSAPLTVLWKGPLVVQPLEGNQQPMMPLAAGQSVVRLAGSPVKLTPDGSTVIAGVATYRSGDGAVQLERSSTQTFVDVIQDKGLRLRTSGFEYDPVTSVVTLGGPGVITEPIKNQPKPMTARWRDRALLHVLPVKGGQGNIDHIDMSGNVVVSHPTFDMTAGELLLDLQPPAEGDPNQDPQLQALRADGDVQCLLHRDAKPDERIDSQKLTMTTVAAANGKRIPRTVLADGSVNATDGADRIRSEHLEALVIPRRVAPAVAGVKQEPADATDSVELESMYAVSAVHADLQSGATADADELRVRMIDGHQQLELSAARGALISDGKGQALRGSVIHVSPDRSVVNVDGAGAMRMLHHSADGKSVQPIDIGWIDAMAFDGVANRADLLGGVTVTTTDAEGTCDTVVGDRAHLELENTPAAAHPVTHADPKPSKRPATKPVAADPNAAAFGDKQPKVLTLYGHIRGTSLLSDASGKIRRRGQLEAEKLIYTAADGTTEIPGPGRLLFENHMLAKAGESTGNRGALAVSWKQRLLYETAAHQITITGSTVVGFLPDKTDPKSAANAPMQMTCDRMLIDLKSDTPDGATGAGAKSAEHGAFGSGGVSSVRFDGNAHFLVQGTEFFADTIVFDPAKNLLTATGTNGRAGQVTDIQGRGTGTFTRLDFNLDTETVEHMEHFQATVRR